MNKIPRVFSPSTSGLRGTWYLKASKGVVYVVCACPSCGKKTQILAEKVHKTGILNITLDCSGDGCGFDDPILLKAYTPNFCQKDPKITKKNR